MTEASKLSCKKGKRYLEEKSIFLLVSSKEEFDAYINRNMNKQMLDRCINICCRYHLIGMFNELAQDYGELLEEIVNDIEKEMESAPCVPRWVQEEMDKWYEDGMGITQDYIGKRTGEKREKRI